MGSRLRVRITPRQPSVLPFLICSEIGFRLIGLSSEVSPFRLRGERRLRLRECVMFSPLVQFRDVRLDGRMDVIDLRCGKSGFENFVGHLWCSQSLMYA